MNRLLARLSIIVAVLLVAASVVSPIVAQSKSVEVPRRDAEITILPNGNVQVVETWEVKFGGGPFTSAYRSIPLNKVDNIDGWGVSDEERSYRQVEKGSSREPYTFEYTIGDGQMKATWFYPATTDQTRRFKVGYTLHGALRIDPAGDEFDWKFIESDRQYPINAARVVLHLPEGFKAEQLKVATYRNGAEQPGARVVDDRTIEFTGGPFPAKTEWAIDAQFPHGVVKADPPAWQVAARQKPSVQQSEDQEIAAKLQHETMVRNLALGVAAVACVGAGVWAWQLKRRRNVSFARWAVILLIPGAAYTAVSVLFGSFIWGVACLVTLLSGFLTMIVASVGKRSANRDVGSGIWATGSPPSTWQSDNHFSHSDWSDGHDFGSSNLRSGGDFGGGGSHGGSGSDGGGGGSSGFN